jgi:hypothetical protein
LKNCQVTQVGADNGNVNAEREKLLIRVLATESGGRVQVDLKTRVPLQVAGIREDIENYHFQDSWRKAFMENLELRLQTEQNAAVSAPPMPSTAEYALTIRQVYPANQA